LQAKLILIKVNLDLEIGVLHTWVDNIKKMLRFKKISAENLEAKNNKNRPK
jgi:hypothetical protein